MASPILNPLTVESGSFNPTGSEWRKVHVDLSAYQKESSALLKVNYISGMGGCINIDNLVVSNVAGTDNLKKSKIGINFYPNPNNGKLFFDEPIKEETEWVIYDAAGKIVYSNVLEIGQLNLELSSLMNGIYTIQFNQNQNTSNKRLVINQ